MVKVKSESGQTLRIEQAKVEEGESSEETPQGPPPPKKALHSPQHNRGTLKRFGKKK